MASPGRGPNAKFHRFGINNASQEEQPIRGVRANDQRADAEAETTTAATASAAAAAAVVFDIVAAFIGI